MKIEKFNYRDIILPPTAVAIKVTNILTPYIIRIHEIKDYEEKLNFINKKLLLLTKKGLINADVKHAELKVGKAVIVHNKFDKNVDLPNWLCRGTICNIKDNSKNMYNVLLTDYGTSVELHKEDFIPYFKDLISKEYLSFTIGLYNVLPTAAKYNLSTQKEVLIVNEWSVSAIEYAKQLVTASTAAYFDYLVSDKHGRNYGEIYLNIEDTIITLSEALILNDYAISLNEELLKLLKNPRDNEKISEEIINDETIFYVNISKNVKSNDSYIQESYKRTNEFRKNKHFHTEFSKEKEKVLIYGTDKYEYLNSISDAGFPTDIHKAWKLLVQSSRPKKVQSYMWPAIKKGLDVITIGPANSGKTFGYVFALCGLLATHSNLPQGVKPSALILCSSSSEVLEVHSLCVEFLQKYVSIRCVAAINGKSERSLVAEMFNGCQILITTPRFLVRFMDHNTKLLNFKDLKYLILDNGDILLDKYFDSISKLFKKHNIIYSRELECKRVTLQIIIAAKSWTLQLKRIAYVLMNSPYICIASFIEAAVFKSIHPKMYVINSNNKEKKILDLLSDEYSKVRTIIVCINSDEAERLNKFLKKYQETLLAHEDMNFLHLQSIKQCWNACVNGSYPILICTDDILSDIDITNAIWLIHYSISLDSKTQFNFRFSTLLDSLQMEKPNCRVTIIADEKSDIQFLSIIKIMQRMNVSISQNILKNINCITVALEKKKENYPICDNVKSWGFCSEKSSCTFRHGIIKKIDEPDTNIRINDKVKFRVISINSASHISARIISYIKSDTLDEIEFSNVEYMQITMKIQEFYSCIENRRRCETIEEGIVCGLEEPVDSFKRVQILYIEKGNKKDNSKFVDVRCIDNGTILTKVNANRLLYMPDEFIKYPSQVVEVFLVGIAPHDNEYIWNNCATDTVYQWFKEHVDERSYVIGTVNLYLRNTIWVDTLEVGTQLIGYKDLIMSSLKAELLKKDHAIENDQHLYQMYQLCKDAGFLEINGFNLNVLKNGIT